MTAADFTLDIGRGSRCVGCRAERDLDDLEGELSALGHECCEPASAGQRSI